jgi:hypothetical protein
MIGGQLSASTNADKVCKDRICKSVNGKETTVLTLQRACPTRGDAQMGEDTVLGQWR